MMRYLLLLVLLIPFQISGIEFVTIADPGNKPASNGKGNVSYIYQISAYEITNQEYCLFLNSVAFEEDKYGLFSPLMEEHFFGGITRTFAGGCVIYSVRDGYESLPVVGVTWMSAVRYCNWLHYNSSIISSGTCHIADYKAATEGDDKHGAYDTRSIPLTRNQGARYWLPNINEWLKAAYYNGTEWNESFFPKGSNCYLKTGWAYPYPHLKAVGLSVEPSYYGTFDQQGNAAEWIEDFRPGDRMWKLALGGSLIRPSSFAHFNETEADFPEKSITTFGLRICRSSDSLLLVENTAIYSPMPASKSKKLFYSDKLKNDYVLVDDAFNRGDIVNRFFGRVNYDYYIARTELSNDSYCKFLNAVTKYGDPYGLYDENMQYGVCGGIICKQKDDEYIYSCKEGWGNKPVVYVNYYDICRFANWMHYGCPQTGKSEIGTTEGTTELGAYNTLDFERVRKGEKPPYELFGKRNHGALFWIPSENEWYKAAYYDPTSIGNRKYHNYPTCTSDAPFADQANYMINNHLSVGPPFYLAPVDSFQNAPSFFGTLQQGGNVWEWIEDWQYGIVGSRGLRGGSWSYTLYGLNGCNTDPGSLDNSGYVFGARLCMAVDKQGWKPATTPFGDRIYEFVLLMPQKHMLFVIIVLGLMSLLGSIWLLVVSISVVRKIKSK